MALRTSIHDFYFNSWRLAPANLVWAMSLGLVFLAGPSLLGVLIVVLVSVPFAGLHRLAALIARGEPAAFSDFAGGMRRYGAHALVVGAAAVALGVVFITNVFVGLANGTPVGWFLTAFALHGLVALALFLLVFWPILVDPRRETLGIRSRVALAGLTVIARPGRLVLLGIVTALLLAVSIVLFVAILLVSGAYLSLVASRYVLPMVDELEARLPRGRTIDRRLPAADH